MLASFKIRRQKSTFAIKYHDLGPRISTRYALEKLKFTDHEVLGDSVFVRVSSLVISACYQC